jgi:dihydrofolate reductase
MSINEFIFLIDNDQTSDFIIIGGSSLYEELITRADRMIITHVDLDVEGDRFFPEIEKDVWVICKEVSVENDNHPYRIRYYDRINEVAGI